MLADIGSGDAVTNLNDEVFAQQEKENKEDFDQIDKEYKAAMSVNDNATQLTNTKQQDNP